MSKLYYEIFDYYSDSFVKEFLTDGVIEDTPENRKESLIKECFDLENNSRHELDKFVNRQSNSFYAENAIEDLSDSVAREVVLMTFEEKKNQIDNDYLTKTNRLNQLFNETS